MTVVKVSRDKEIIMLQFTCNHTFSSVKSYNDYNHDQLALDVGGAVQPAFHSHPFMHGA